jgi:aminopeptidase
MEMGKRLADLAVVVGANVQAGQVVRVSADVEHADLVRDVADAAYRNGARFVEVDLGDVRVRRSQILHATGDLQVHMSAWMEAGIRELDVIGGARIMIHGPGVSGLLAGLDPARVRQSQPPRSQAWRDVEYRVNNTMIPGPTRAWACALHPDLSAVEALARLWEQIEVACRLDQRDPVAAWRDRFAELRRVADVLSVMSLDAVRLRGPGTELVIGLVPTARWESPTHVNERGIEHAWNLPSEEIYTVPDPDRVDGHVRLTRPVVVAERLVHDVSLTFRGGDVVEVTGAEGVGALREFIARDAGTRRLGELVLVDSDSAVGSVGETFGMVMLDENAASHIALGFGFPELVGVAYRDRVNQSGDHLDVTVGSDQLEFIGIDKSGDERPLLRGGQWQIAGA